MNTAIAERRSALVMLADSQREEQRIRRELSAANGRMGAARRHGDRALMTRTQEEIASLKRQLDNELEMQKGLAVDAREEREAAQRTTYVNACDAADKLLGRVEAKMQRCETTLQEAIRLAVEIEEDLRPVRAITRFHHERGLQDSMSVLLASHPLFFRTLIFRRLKGSGLLRGLELRNVAGLLVSNPDRTDHGAGLTDALEAFRRFIEFARSHVPERRPAS